MSGASEDERDTLVGLFYTWWHGDPLPELDPLPGFSLTYAEDTALFDHLSDLTERDIRGRVSNGHRPYLALVDGEPVAYGWSAWERAEIGELGISFELPTGERYLWDFVTLPEWRGRGIYPHMLQGIIRAEMDGARRFWIGHDLDNVASARGIEKAGLPVIGEVWIRDGVPIFVPRANVERAETAAALLKLSMGSAR
jgi:GNAT superfamily N-acetyltransferase